MYQTGCAVVKNKQQETTKEMLWQKGWLTQTEGSAWLAQGV